MASVDDKNAEVVNIAYRKLHSDFEKINLPFLFSQSNNQPNMDPEIEIVAVVPPPGPRPVEVCPVSNGTICPICTFEFEDGERVVVMGCDGRHIMHSGCYEMMAEDDKRQQEQTYAHTLFEAVRRHEGASKCPVCRQASHCAIEALAMVFYSGKTTEDAIRILDGDVMADVVGVNTHPGHDLWLEQESRITAIVGDNPMVWDAFEDNLTDSSDEEWFDAEG
jgi:hypothetical protein